MTHHCTVGIKDIDALCVKNASWCRRMKIKWLKNVIISPKVARCTQYFKSATGIRLEKERQLNSKYPYIIHPLSNFRYWYDMYLLLLSTVTVLSKPVEATFTKKDEAYNTFRKTNLVFDGLCYIDIIINFFSGYEISGKKEIDIDLPSIIRHYLTNAYLYFDFLSSVPTNYFEINVFPDHVIPVLVVLRLCKLLKLIRIKIVAKKMLNIAENFSVESTSAYFLLSTTFISIIIVHYTACFIFLVPKYADVLMSEPQKNSWIFLHDLYEKPIAVKYVHSFFKASSYLIGIRLINLYALQTTYDYCVTIFAYIVGRIVLAVIWIKLALVFLNKRTTILKYNKMLNQLNEYMNQKNLSTNFKNRIVHLYTFKYRKQYFEDELIESLLSEKLRREIRIHVYKSFLRQVTFFSEFTSDQIDNMVVKLHPQIFLPNEAIITSKTLADSLYFIATGTVAVYTHSGKEVCHLQDGAFFGDTCLLEEETRREINVTAVETTEVYKLMKPDFEQVLTSNKQVFQKFYRQAKRKSAGITEIERRYRQTMFHAEYSVD